MQLRSRMWLIVVYLLLTAAGIVFLYAPPPALEKSVYDETVAWWGWFYVVGGIASTSGLIARLLQFSMKSAWYFEIAGLSLLVAATLVYSFALFEAAIRSDQLHTAAAGIVVLGFASSLSVRVLEGIETVRVADRVIDDIDKRNGRT